MHYKQSNKESKTFVQGLRPFGNTLPRGVRGILKKSGYNYSEIIGKWSALVGNEISSCAYPKAIKIKKGNLNGTLVLAVKRGDEIKIEYSKKNIINKINSFFGYKLISEIKLTTFSNKEESVEKKIFKNKFQKISIIKLIKYKIKTLENHFCNF